MIGTAFYGALAYLVWVRVKNKKLKLILVALLVIWELLIAYSRVYLNVHYPTDVVAGLAAGLFWLALSVLLLRQLELFIFYKDKRIPETKPQDKP
jgi:undecaprenyl-diphosphatase